MRWAAVVSLTLAVGSACGGRSEYFDDTGGSVAGEAGDDSGGASGKGGGSGKGGVSGTGGDTGGFPSGGNFPTGGIGATGGVFPTGGTPAGGAFPTGGRGGTGIGGVVAGGAGGVPMGGASGSSVGGSSIGGTSGRGGTGTGGVGGVVPMGGTSGTMTGGRGGTNMGGTGGVTPEDCLECISNSCPEATACFQNPLCVEGLICGASVCANIEGPEALRCWTQCFGGDARLALQALTAAICLGQNCSMACQGF